MKTTARENLKRILEDAAEIFQKTSGEIGTLEKIFELLHHTLKQGAKILLCGNGGSAAECQHIAAEFVGRYKKERRGLPAVALTTDTSILTAVGNDYSFDEVFARQLEALGEKGDLLLLLSTSGNSKNCLLACERAKRLGIKTVAFTGAEGGRLKDLADLTFFAPSKATSHIQEVHLTVLHALCEMVEESLLSGSG